MVRLEFGSDIGGSIRVPAHFCGVFGHKPTYGIVPSRGHLPPSLPALPVTTDLAVIGPMARSVDDLAWRSILWPARTKRPRDAATA